MAGNTKSNARKSAEINDIFPHISAFPAFLSALLENLPGPAIDAPANWWQAYITGATEMNKEFMAFVASRLKDDVELAQALNRCRTWQEATNVHRQWLQKMSEEYMEEAKTLLAIASCSARECRDADNDGSHERTAAP